MKKETDGIKPICQSVEKRKFKRKLNLRFFAFV